MKRIYGFRVGRREKIRQVVRSLRDHEILIEDPFKREAEHKLDFIASKIKRDEPVGDELCSFFQFTEAPR